MLRQLQTDGIDVAAVLIGAVLGATGRLHLENLCVLRFLINIKSLHLDCWVAKGTILIISIKLKISLLNVVLVYSSQSAKHQR